MFSQLTEQVKKSSQPASDLFAANVKALQAVSEQQTSLVSGVITDSVKLLKTVSEQTEVKGLLAAQSVYAESVRERLTSTSKNTYGTLNTVSQQFADVMKTSFETAKEVAESAGKSVANAPVTTKPAAKKVAAKKATPKAATPAPAAEEAPAKADTAASEAPTAPSKPVPTLSADNVRASKPAAKKAPAKKPAAKKAAPKVEATPAPKAEEKK